MWISKKKYFNLRMRLDKAIEINDKLIEINKELCNKVEVLENDKKILLNILNPDILGLDFPNTNERGKGDSGTPTNFSDIFNV